MPRLSFSMLRENFSFEIGLRF